MESNHLGCFNSLCANVLQLTGALKALINKTLFKVKQIALSPAFTGSIVRKRWLKTPRS